MRTRCCCVGFAAVQGVILSGLPPSCAFTNKTGRAVQQIDAPAAAKVPAGLASRADRAYLTRYRCGAAGALRFSISASVSCAV